MPDPMVLAELRDVVRERDSGQVHTPESRATSTDIDAGERVGRA
ncbi:hypothetical protein GALL_302760 [mine drainage metagenome]|uniref:Uncharacterized protein n=1 Tax=mine drainage metagenome TaxID=410659 RepID=A0A1J5QW22_9ZZZZ